LLTHFGTDVWGDSSSTHAVSTSTCDVSFPSSGYIPFTHTQRSMSVSQSSHCINYTPRKVTYIMCPTSGSPLSCPP
jgi:hypothetical protein